MRFKLRRRQLSECPLPDIATPADQPQSATSPRTQSRDARRARMIEATIDSLADKGYSRTTLTDVAARAGTSHGLVLFHFGSKENLLAATLDFLTEEYRQNWQSALAVAGTAPEEQIRALIKADFNEAICTPSRLSAWCAFWGESQSRPLYQAHSAANDDAYNENLVHLCGQMNDLYGFSQDPERSGRLIRFMIEGVWLDLITLAKPYSVAEAYETVLHGARALYPGKF